MAPLAASTATWIFIIVPLIVVWAIGIVDILRRQQPLETGLAGGPTSTP